LVERFAAYHRKRYACKVSVGDVLIGAAQTVGEYNGVHKASHFRDKIVEMNHLNETLYCGCFTCACQGYKGPSGTYSVNTLPANVHKHNVTRFPYEIARLAQDIAGGLMVPLPSERDFQSVETAHWIEKYLWGTSDVPTVNRLRILRLIKNLTMGSAAGRVPYRIYAWCRLTSGPENHDFTNYQHGRKEKGSQKALRHP
jgi:4-hydroxybutyryl-CoA dehydratase/vinylacetyl-CoA-Delta-isomerase